MQKRHFERMAAIVLSILQGEWTNERPSWAPCDIDETTAVTRAVQTAEAFIMLASEDNPRFDRTRFLIACGLADKPVKAPKRRRVISDEDAANARPGSENE